MSKNWDKILLLAILGGLVSLGINGGLDYLNQQVADYLWYIINFSLWFILSGVGAYHSIKENLNKTY